MAQAEATLRVVAASGTPLPAAAPFLDKSVRERWNDYGIGLLLQGDLKAAEAAFLKVTEMEPGYADGWVNVGARADPGRQHGGRGGDAAAGARDRSASWPRRTSSWARRSRASAATTRR